MNDTKAIALADATHGTTRNLMLLRQRFFKISPRTKSKGIAGHRRPGTKPNRAIRLLKPEPAKIKKEVERAKQGNAVLLDKKAVRDPAL